MTENQENGQKTHADPGQAVQNAATPGHTTANGGCLKTALIVLATVVVTAGLTFWILTTFIFPGRFTPVDLSASEQQVLERKLAVFEGLGAGGDSDTNADGTVKPEKYSEENADRTIALTERELNGLLANNTNMAQRLAIDLSDDLASAKLLIPLDPDFPVMGGKTLKLTAGMQLEFANDRPVVVLRGVSIMGVPMPNAWLGGLKNVDLVSEFGDAGFWKAFAEGVEMVRVEEGELVIRLKE